MFNLMEEKVLSLVQNFHSDAKSLLFEVKKI